MKLLLRLVTILALASCPAWAMTKADLIEKIAKDKASDGITKKDVRMVVNSMLEEIAVALKNGENVRIPKFGRFIIKTKEKRDGTTKKVVKFKPAKALKDTVK